MIYNTITTKENTKAKKAAGQPEKLNQRHQSKMKGSYSIAKVKQNEKN